MKKLILSLAALSLFSFAGFSQGNAKTHAAHQNANMNPNDKAEVEAGKVAKHLQLNESQRSQVKQFALTRINANAPLREKAQSSTDKAVKQSMHQQIKANTQTYYNNVNGILTPDQQTKWAEFWKKRQEKQGHHQE